MPDNGPEYNSEASADILVPAEDSESPLHADSTTKISLKLEDISVPGTENVSNLAMELRLERLRIEEALSARDIAVKRLAEACASVRQKNTKIEKLQEDKDAAEKQAVLLSEKMETNRQRVAEVLKELQKRIKPQGQDENYKLDTSLPKDGESMPDWETSLRRILSLVQLTPPIVFRDISNDGCRTPISVPASPRFATNFLKTPQLLTDELNIQNLTLEDSTQAGTSGAQDREVSVPSEARNTILAALSLPSETPPEILRPIAIPTHYTFHDFLGSVPISLRTQLGNYRIFQQATTYWCPDREEHGYFLTPVFRCHTNPRVNTAHRWAATDISSKLDKPTECFYTKDGKWYYAGIYKAFRMADLSPLEWEGLSSETTQALIKDTLANRKNTCPQNVYETGQLYTAGALRVACIGLQCVGFDQVLYRMLIEHASQFPRLLQAKWRGGPTPPSVLSSPVASWNTTPNVTSPTQVSALAACQSPRNTSEC